MASLSSSSAAARGYCWQPRLPKRITTTRKTIFAKQPSIALLAKYRGDSKNRGRLHERNEWGEYLDVKAIVLAKQDIEHAVKHDIPGYKIPEKLQLKKTESFRLCR